LAYVKQYTVLLPLRNFVGWGFTTWIGNSKHYGELKR
jgi:hypothetical protein